MIDPNTYGIFFATALILVITPGPDTILVLTRTIASGTRPGLWTLAGTQTGNVIHAMLAGLGISTVILLFPPAFQILKVAGTGYLIYLAVKTWRAAPGLALATASLGMQTTAGGFFVQGLANNLVNPKVIPFFLALFPQFIRPDSGDVALQSFILGSTLAAIALVWVGGLALIIGRMRSFVAQSECFVAVLQRIAALAFVGLAARLLVSER